MQDYFSPQFSFIHYLIRPMTAVTRDGSLGNSIYFTEKKKRF